MQRLAITLITMLALFSFSSTVFADEITAENENTAKREPLTYTGWAVIKRNAIDPKADEEEWISIRGIEMTDDGIKLRLQDGEQDTPYTIELIVITYTETDTTVLKLALYEEGKDSAITYIWGEPGAKRLGMNLRWMQVGLAMSEAE